MTIHPIRTSGMIINTYQTFSYYEKMQDRVTKFVCECSGISEKTFLKLMNNKNQLSDDTGTVIIGEQAVKCGLINEIGSLSKAIQKIKEFSNCN